MIIDRDLTTERYHALPGWSPSRLARVYTSSVAAALRPVAESEAMRAGTAVHALLAGEAVHVIPDSVPAPDTVAELREALRGAGVTAPSGARKPDLVALCAEHGIETRDQVLDRLRAEAGDAPVLTEAQHRYCVRAAEVAAEALERAGVPWWLTAGEAEASLLGAELDGVPVRCRPDRLIQLTTGDVLVVSWKTTGIAGAAAPSDWARRYRHGGYACADAAYIAIVEAVTGQRCIGIAGLTIELPGWDRSEWSQLSADSCLAWQVRAGSRTHAHGARQLSVALERVQRYITTGAAGYAPGVVDLDEV